MTDDDDKLPADDELPVSRNIQPDDSNNIPADEGDEKAENKEDNE